MTAAGAVLDGAALAVSTVDIERDVHTYDPDQQPGDPISVTRSEWGDAVASP